MNRRNLQVFGPSKNTRYLIVGITVVVVLLLAAWLLMQNDSPTAAAVNQPSNQLTGATAQQGQQQQPAEEEQQQEEIQREERQYFSYKGQCAFDMKQRQDDLGETKNGVDAYQQEITKLAEEYDAKKRELEEQYTVPLTNLKVKLEKAQKEFSDAQQRYDIAKATCDAQQPA